MQIKQVLTQANLKLERYDIKNPHLDTEAILAFVLKKPREFLLAHGEREIKNSEINKFNLLINKRAKGIPLAYITGEKYFYGLKFIVDKNTLVPRPETELLVEQVLFYSACCVAHKTRRIKNTTKTKLDVPIIVDIGTGSGCIAVSLAKHIKTKIFATDISKSALRIAQKNAKIHGLSKKIKFLHGNLLKPLIDSPKLIASALPANKRNCKFIIVANLPYLAPAQVKNSPTIQSEPKSALVAGKDGLKYYRGLFKQIKKYELNCQVFCEIDPSQKKSIQELAQKILPNSKVETKKDLRGLCRLAIVEVF